MASFEITGKLKVKNDKQVVSDKFTKREFVITTEAVSYTHLDVYKRQIL